MCFQLLEKLSPLGFLILRMGIGSMFIMHGYGKLIGGEEMFEKLGSAVGFFGIHSGFKFFGLMASLSEFVGGICLILGLFFRPACFFLFITMAVAAAMHLEKGDGLNGASHAIEAGILFLSLVFIGPGPNNLDDKFKNNSKK